MLGKMGTVLELTMMAKKERKKPLEKNVWEFCFKILVQGYRSSNSTYCEIHTLSSI